MLSAQKEPISQALTVASEELPNVGSFGKVVNSIQGLQQRLESFSAEDVGVAHDRTQTLLLRLADLQRKLTDFAAIKESMATVGVSVEQMLPDCLDPLKLEPVNQPLQIHTLIQASNLIHFPRLNKLLTNDNPSVLTANATPVDARIADDSSTQDHETSQSVEQSVENELPEETTDEMSDALAVPDDVFNTGSPEQRNSTDISPLPITPEVFSAAQLDSAFAVEPVVPETEVCQDQVPDSELPSGTTIDGANTSATQHESAQASLAKTGTNFDHRLLDDLIKNYGEFAAALSSTRTTSAQDVARESSAPAVTDNPLQPADVPVERDNLPEVKKHGDIDRQLKKIIKDYGEYDLYSRQGPVNLKTGVIAAFLLLALLLSGFYYFSPGGSQHSTPAPTHSSGPTQAAEGQSVGGQQRMPAGDAAAPHGTDINSRPKNRK